MKYKTAFRLAVRAIGVLLIAQNLPWLLGGCASIGLRFVVPGGPGLLSGLWEWELQTSLVHLGETLVGLYLFFGGKWIVNKAIPSNRPYCHECGYEITGLPAEGVCPECGTSYRRNG